MYTLQCYQGTMVNNKQGRGGSGVGLPISSMYQERGKDNPKRPLHNWIKKEE